MRYLEVVSGELHAVRSQLWRHGRVVLPRLHGKNLEKSGLITMYFRSILQGLPVARWVLVVLLGSLVVSRVSGWAQSSGESSQSAANSQVKSRPALAVNAQDYVIAPDDLLEVYILDVPELSRAYRVSQSGAFVFPLLPKPLMAAGLTLDAFSALLTNELKTTGTISDPHLNVSVKESRLHSISVTGAVKSPQVYPLLGPSKG